MTESTDREWLRKAVALIGVLVLLSPAFGWMAAQVGYTEPLQQAADVTGADDAGTTHDGLLSGYSIDGLPKPVGTLASAVIGSGLLLGAGLLAGRLFAD